MTHTVGVFLWCAVGETVWKNMVEGGKKMYWWRKASNWGEERLKSLTGAHTTQLYRDHFKNHYTDPVLNPSHCSNTSEWGATDRRRYSQYYHLLPEYIGHLRKIVMLQPYWWYTSNWQSVSTRWNKALQLYVTGNVAKVANQLFHLWRRD